MKQITITITPNGLIIDGKDIIVIALNAPEIIAENFFLKTMTETATICLN